MAETAGELYAAYLKVGRVLPTPLLALVVLLRNVVFLVLSDGSFSELVAPAWVVVTRHSDGSVVGRLSAGREPGAGEHILTSVRADLRRLRPAEFLQRWHLS